MPTNVHTRLLPPSLGPPSAGLLPRSPLAGPVPERAGSIVGQGAGEAMRPPRLSAVLIVRDEVRILRRCLEALAFADEILVVDSGSTDGTQALARELGARVLERPFDGYGAQKRFAVEQAANDWVLSVDADEVVTPELAASIRALLAGPAPASAWRIRLPLVFMGRRFTHGAYANDWHVRLFDRRRAQFDGAPVHERVVTAGEVGTIRAGAILHHTVRDLEHYVLKMNAYSSRGAEELDRRGKRRSAALVLLSWPFYFFRNWVLRGNVLNGVPGLVWSMVHSLEPIVKYLKLVERRAAR